MKIVGLTGGIGSGKSTAARFFEEKGYAVYNSDNQAKVLMIENKNLKKGIIELIGKEAYLANGELNRKFIAQKIFSDKELLRKQNLLVHKAVKDNFEHWVSLQKGDFCIKEAAILFESGAYKSCDFTVVVTASEEIRIQRAVDRDKVKKEEVLKRMQNQWKQEKLLELADFSIENGSDLQNIEKEVNIVISEIKKRL